MTWEMQRNHGRSGTGHWKFWTIDMDDMRSVADGWRRQVENREKLWLCWNINDRWCQVQQRLILEVGWTPVVGWDPASIKTPPKLVPGAIAIDFNENLHLPTLYPHVPLEFAFLWSDKLATWHSDLLLSREKMRAAAAKFERAADGEVVAVKSYGGLKNFFNRRLHRYWEVLACTTRAASYDQFVRGSGWWRGISHHPSIASDFEEKARRLKFYDDHGCGIEYWRRFYSGRVTHIKESWISKEHFSVISVRNYVKMESKSDEIDYNFDLGEITSRLGIRDLLDV